MPVIHGGSKANGSRVRGLHFEVLYTHAKPLLSKRCACLSDASCLNLNDIALTPQFAYFRACLYPQTLFRGRYL